jgi:hypothetical protein
MAGNLEFTFEGAARDYAVKVVHTVCCIAGSGAFVDDIRLELRHGGILDAVARHDTEALFRWLMIGLSFQGISDAVADGYMARHGTVSWSDVGRALASCPSCPRLTSYWQFYGCQYHKGSRTCAEPNHIDGCPLPTHRLRNGRLNQAAYSLFLFIRDIAGGDLVAWIDEQLRQAANRHSSASDRTAAMRDALLTPLSHVFGVSDKVLSMALSSLLLSARARGSRWAKVGSSMVAIDTLVHNFLHRTGILHRLAARHPYGPACYEPDGCEAVVRLIANEIDARQFNSKFPKIFPRFVQHAVWRYCAGSVFDECNGNTVDDRDRCANDYCRLYSQCDRLSLNNSAELPALTA